MILTKEFEGIISHNILQAVQFCVIIIKCPSPPPPPPHSETLRLSTLMVPVHNNTAVSDHEWLVLLPQPAWNMYIYAWVPKAIKNYDTDSLHKLWPMIMAASGTWPHPQLPLTVTAYCVKPQALVSLCIQLLIACIQQGWAHRAGSLPYS